MGLFGFEDEDKEKTEGAEERPEAELEDGDVVRLDEDEEDTSRRGKKRARAEEIISQQQRELTELRERVSRGEGVMSMIPSIIQQNQQQGPDQLTLAIDKAYEDEVSFRNEANEIYARAQREKRELTADEKRDMQRKAKEIDMRRTKLLAAQANRELGIRPVNPAEGIQAYVQATYADVYKDPRMKNWAQARYAMRIAEGAQDSQELLTEVMGETRKKFGLKPSDSAKGKWAGSAGGAGGGGERPEGVRITKEIKEIATSMYSDRTNLTDAQKIKLWVKECGQEYQEALRDSRETG